MENLRCEQFNYNQVKSMWALLNYANTFGIHMWDEMERGYNPNSGYVYIAYECGLTIAIFEGRDNIFDVVLFGYDDNGEIEYDTLEDFKAEFLV